MKVKTTFERMVGSAISGLLLVGMAQASLADEVQPDYLASPEVYKVIAENDEIRLILATWPPGYKDKMHSHPKMFAVYTVKDCEHRLNKPDGKFVVKQLKAETGRINNPVEAHYAENVGKSECQQVLFELKK